MIRAVMPPARRCV